ncbi:MAG: hypothetical protein Q9M36_03500 [Sulfurovum sp.]|nr:hypothetical protein [Sulfurovum sp.]
MNFLLLYTLPIRYMILFSLAIFSSGVWLFILSSDTPKSMHNIIEIATPHLFAMGALLFLLAHFLLFSTLLSQKKALVLVVVTYGLLFVNIFAYFLIDTLGIAPLWLKYITLGGFGSCFVLLLGLLWFSV